MKHLYLNLKRFDVPVEYGGVNRIAPVGEWGRYIVTRTQEGLKGYDPAEAEFVQYFPEAHILGAVGALCPDSPVQVGSQGVYRVDTAVGGNFGALTTSRPASIVKAMGCTAACAEEKELAAARQFAFGLGMAFQLRDDVLDVLGDAAKLGKNTGMDSARDKRNYVSLLGVEEAQRLVEQYTKEALDALEAFPGDTTFLREFALSLVERES